MIERTIYLDLWRELSSEKQMIFLSGPRQVGKLRSLMKSLKNLKTTYISDGIL